jgi:hypothetical protein
VSVLLLACRLALAGTFLVAGSAKLADLPGARAAAAGMRVPRPLARAGMPALAGFELVIGLGLVPAPSARYAAVAAAVTLLGVTAVAGSAIARGLRVECHCFGRLGGGRIGAATLVRNAAILALSAFVAIGGWAYPGATAPGWLDRPAATIAEFAALLLLAAATAGLALSRGPRDAPAARPASPGIGSATPDFRRQAPPRGDHRAGAQPLLPIRRPIPPAEQIVLRAVDGRAVGLQALLGQASLAVFIRPECIFSRRLLPELQKLPARSAANAPGLVLICHGDPRDMGLGELRLPVFADISGAAGPALGAAGTPAAVLTRSGRPVAPPVSGAARVLAAARGETPAPADCGCARP